MKNLFDQWNVSLAAMDKGPLKADVCVIPVYAQKKVSPWVQAIDKAHDGIISSWLESSYVGEDREKSMFFVNKGDLAFKDFLVISLGDAKKAGQNEIRNAFGKASKLISQRGYKSVAVVHGDEKIPFEYAMDGFLLGSYRFSKYKEDVKQSQSLQTFIFATSHKNKKTYEKHLSHTCATTRAIFLARDLVNEPGNVVYPESFASIAKNETAKRKITYKVLSAAELKKQNFNLHLAVGQASDKQPCLVHLHYKPTKKAKKKVALVGKGITFDTGGLSLKPPTYMVSMKTDMAGAAGVLAAMTAIADLALPVEVHGIMALAENAVNGNATRPDDVVRARNGKTVEIENTDAEGRLVLADALHYAENLGVDYIVDAATLTGACVIALGDEIFAIYSKDAKLASLIENAASDVGDKGWRMPLEESYKSQLKSDVADMKNVGGREGGSITAALFLSNFVEKTAWAHLDVAGPARASREFDTIPKGGSGVPTRTFIRFVETL
ncbi:MAG: leucyl aminopeptidase [Bdellovibrionales bacterium]|nr:leucyl aminopeptidase [Bdellovibrionales bacterium]